MASHRYRFRGVTPLCESAPEQRSALERARLMAPQRRLQHRLEKSLFNPAFRAALRLGIAPRAFALLETSGRRSGRRRQTPVGNGLDGDVFWLVSEHSRKGDYVKNLCQDPRVRVKVGRRWHTGTATVIDEDDAHARRRIDEVNGLVGRVDGVIFRASASTPVTVRIDRGCQINGGSDPGIC